MNSYNNGALGALSILYLLTVRVVIMINYIYSLLGSNPATVNLSSANPSNSGE